MNRNKLMRSFVRGAGSVLDLCPAPRARPLRAFRFSTGPNETAPRYGAPGLTEDAKRILLCRLVAWLQLVEARPELLATNAPSLREIEVWLNSLSAPAVPTKTSGVGRLHIDASNIATDRTRARQQQIEAARQRLRRLSALRAGEAGQE